MLNHLPARWQADGRSIRVMNYFVSTSHVNAWSVRKGLREFGLDCSSLQPRAGLVPKAKSTPGFGDVIFFTEEDSLVRYLADNSDHFHFYPRAVAVSPDDKLAFADAVKAIGESPVPYWAIGDVLPNDPPSLPIVVKARFSWRNGRKFPRGWVCTTAKEYADACLAIRQAGFAAEDFLIQELIPDADVVSTCGFFDAFNHSRNIFLITRKLLGQGGSLTTGVVVKTIPDPGGLLSRTIAILDAFRYRGPFEMEFIEDYRRGTYHILELNMRFWMQHGLFIDGCGNRLLERYLDRDDPRAEDGQTATDVRLVWVDRLALFAAIARGRWAFLRSAWQHCRVARNGGARIVCYPDAVSTIRFLGVEMIRRVRGCFVATVGEPRANFR